MLIDFTEFELETIANAMEDYINIIVNVIEINCNKLRNIFGSASIITYRIEKTTKYNKKFTNIFISTYL